MGKFDGKVVIVTGSSSGIGRATAELFAKEGAKVTITGRNPNDLEESKQLAIKAGGKEDNLLAIVADVTKEEDTTKLIDETVKKFGQIDVLVNNAGGGTAAGYQDCNLDKPLAVYDYVMNLNCRSVLDLCQKAIPHLKKTKGNIVNVSSVAAFKAHPMLAYYGMAKAANDHMTRNLCLLLAPDGIRVNTLNPGPVRTNFNSRNGVPASVRDMLEELWVKPNVPMARSADPWEMATIIAFLANEKESSYITGQTIVADGGVSHALPPMPKEFLKP